jgi:competence protein ComEA
LSWDDLLPGWPDDVTLEPRPGEEAQPPPPRPVEPVAEDLAYRPAWAAGTGARRPIRPPALFGPEPAGVEDDRFGAGSLATDRLFAAEHARMGVDRCVTGAPVTDDGPLVTDYASVVTDHAEPAGGSALSGAGAFDGAARSRLGAFDPGRGGVRALAAVAVVVVLVAAFLAWRARPRLDPVAPPATDLAAGAPLTTDGTAAAVAGAAPSASSPAGVVVAVGGKVHRPGLVQLPPGARVADALRAAGGADPGVDVAPLNLARKVADGELIMVGVTLPPGAVAAGPTGPAAPGRPAGGPINLNLATLADLDSLPGVGPVLAQRILEARDAQGGFRAVTDLRKVEGIGTARFEQLKDLVTV